MPIREEKANFGQNFSMAIVLRARALESYRNVQQVFAEAKEKSRAPSFEELAGADETMNKALTNLNKSQRLIHLLLGQYPEKKAQLDSILEKLSVDMAEAVRYSDYVSKLHYDQMPVTVSNPFARSTKPILSVRPSQEMTVHEAPDTQPRTYQGRDANFSDDDVGDDYYDEDEVRDDVETMLSGLGATLNHLGGPGLVFLQKQLAKLIEKL